MELEGLQALLCITIKLVVTHIKWKFGSDSLLKSNDEGLKDRRSN